MKSKVQPYKSQGLKFPVLLELTESYDNIVILARERNLNGGFIGTIVASDNPDNLGRYGTNWDDNPNHYRVLHGIVKLSND